MARYVICPQCGNEIRRNEMFEYDGNPMCVNCLEKKLAAEQKITQEQQQLDSQYRTEIDNIFNQTVSGNKGSNEASVPLGYGFSGSSNLDDEKLNQLRFKGHNGYYEYKAVYASTTKKGELDIEQLISEINNLALEGWKVCDSFNAVLGQTGEQDKAGFVYNLYANRAVIILERFNRF